MRRRTGVAAGVAVVVVGAVVVAVAAGGGDSGGAASSARSSTSLQPVALHTLADTTDVTGTIGYGSEVPVQLGSASPATSSASSAATPSTTSASSASSRSSAGASTGASSGSSSTSGSGSGASATGTITALPAVGTVVQVGQSLAEIDGVPSAFLMKGTRPAWRTFAAGMSDGPDVAQLEQSLADLGYGASLTVDDTFTSGTATAIRSWQKAAGIDETGTLTPQQVVFMPGPVRIASQVATVGSTASGKILTVTGTTPVVHVDLDASKVSYAHPGDQAQVDLPDGSTVTGTILGVGTATSTTSGQGNNATTTTTVGVDLVVPGDLGRFDGASAVVHLVTTKAENVMAVPVKSLVALAEGGYAVERVRDGRHALVAVKPGTYAGGFVQVSGDLRVGDRVVTP